MRQRMLMTTVFQFHKGTIRTGCSVGASSQELQFQFHKGTIRTRITAEAYQQAFANFNSIKVQLERLPTSRLSVVVLVFQFHKGTIRT